MKKYESTWLPIICLIMFFALANGTLLGPVLPEMVEPLETTEQDIGMVIAVFTFATALFTLVFGPLADLLSRKALLIPCMVLNGFAGLACYFAPDFEILLAFRFLQGIGAAGMLLLGMLLIGDLYKGHERVHATSRVGMTSAIGVVSFPVLGGLMALKSWNFPFLFYGLVLPLAVLSAVLLPGGKRYEQGIKNETKIKGIETKLDGKSWKSVVDIHRTKVSPTKLSQIKLSPTKLSQTKLSQIKLSPTKLSPTKLSPTKLSPTKLSPTKLSLKKTKVKEQNQGKNFSELFSVIRDFKVFYAILLGFGIFFLLFVMVIYLPFKLKTDFGYTSGEAGLAQGVIGISVIFVSSRVKRLSLKYSLISLAGAGFFLAALACGLIGLVHSKFLMVPLLMLFGAGGGLIQIMGDTLILQVAPAASTGVTVSMYNSMKYVGQTVSPIFFGFILALSGLRPVFLLGAAFGFFLSGTCWLLKGRFEEEHDQQAEESLQERDPDGLRAPFAEN